MQTETSISAISYQAVSMSHETIAFQTLYSDNLKCTLHAQICVSGPFSMSGD